MPKTLFKHHNAIDINGTVPVIFTPFYQWLYIQHRGGYTYQGLIPALDHYVNLSIKIHKLNEHQHVCYRHIMNTFHRSLILCP
jgi:hypothetical protein